MFRRFTKGKDASPAKDASQSPKKQEQRPEDAEGFLCPMCMARLPGPAELQSHFETVHSEGKQSQPSNTNNESPVLPTAQLINIDDDHTDIGKQSKLQFSDENHPDDAQAEISYLQQEMAELTTAIKEEKWYSGQLKEEFDRVSKERDKLEEEQEEFKQEYDSKLRSAEASFLQVADENEKLKEELKYADYKSQKERHEKMNSEIQTIRLELAQEKEMKSAVEEANRHMMKQIEDKDKLLDDMKLKLNERPSNERIISLESEVKDLKEKLENSKIELGKIAAEEVAKLKIKVEELNSEISRLHLVGKELEIEKTAKAEQIQSIQTALSAALETSKQAQEQAHDKQQQIIDLQHEIREAQASLKEKCTFVTHLEKQLEESKNLCAEEVKMKQDLQQQLRNLQNSLDDELRNVNLKDSRIYELENSLKKEKAEIQRLENEGSELVAKIEAGAGVETAINQLRQEKEKLIDGVAAMEKEAEEQAKKHLTEINEQRDKNTKLVEEFEKQKINNNELNKKINELIREIDIKGKSNEELRSQLRNKSEELRKLYSESSTDKANLEKQIQELGNKSKGQSDEIINYQQKISSLNGDLLAASASLTQHQALLSQEKSSNENLKDQIERLNKDLGEKNELLIKVQNELSKERQEKQKNIEELNNKLADHVNNLDEQKLKIQELSDLLDTKNAEITSLSRQIEKDDEERQLMQKEFDSLRENEASLKSKIQELEDEFSQQKLILNDQINVIRKDKEDTENGFKEKFRRKEELLENLEISHANEVNELNKTIASNMAQHAEDLKNKNEELAFISGSSKEAIAGYQKSVEMLEEALKNETEMKEKLEATVKKVEDEKSVALISLEQKDTTLLEVQRQLEVAQKELKKACEGCKNYEIQLCRFQETHKEQINTVQRFEKQVEELNSELKTSRNDYTVLEKDFENYRTSSEETEAEMRKTIEELTEVKAVLEARVLEIDDEVKESYKKYYDLKTEMKTLSSNCSEQEENIRKLTESKKLLEEEIISVKLSMENLNEQRSKEIEEERMKIEEVVNQKIDVEKQLKEIENQLELEKLNHKETKETTEKMQKVLTEKSNAIQNKLDNSLRDHEEMIKSKEQSEARLSMEITSLKENLIRGRKEMESRDKKIEELESVAKRIEHEKDELKGEIAVMEIQVQHTNDEKRALTERVLQSEDAHKRTKERFSDTNRRLEQSLAALQELGQENQAIQVKQNAKLSRQWEDDSLVTNCKNCDKVFSLTIRKHHCRHCGGIFCNDCSNNYTQVAASKKPVRVCGVCFSDLNTIRGRRLSAASMT